MLDDMLYMYDIGYGTPLWYIFVLRNHFARNLLVHPGVRKNTFVPVFLGYNS